MAGVWVSGRVFVSCPFILDLTTGFHSLFAAEYVAAQRAGPVSLHRGFSTHLHAHGYPFLVFIVRVFTHRHQRHPAACACLVSQTTQQGCFMLFGALPTRPLTQK